jgi:hypothetical protein
MKNEEKVKLKHAKAIDVKGIIELLTQLERPLPKDNFYKKIGFQQIALVFKEKLGKKGGVWFVYCLPLQYFANSFKK